MRITRLLLALLVATVGLLVPTVKPAQAAPGSASNHLAGCLQSADTLSALFVFDRSWSLNNNDPSGVRYDALKVALEQLAQLTATGGHELAVEAAVSSFDNEYYQARNVVEWKRLDSAAFSGDQKKQQQTIETITSEARQHSQPAGGTNFQQALTGALGDMADRRGGGTCRVVFWFTDGTFSIGGGEEPLRRDMCRAGGLLDQIRQAGIVLIGIQLKDPKEPADARDLWPMSEGKDPKGHTCGTMPIPSDWAPGQYLLADDTAALKRIFGSVSNIVQGCTPADANARVIDPGIRRFRATITTPSRITALRLDSPDGTTISAGPDGTTRQGGYSVAVNSDDHYVAFEVSLPPGQGHGKWTFSTAPATTTTDSSLCVFHDLHFELANPKQQFSAGVPTEVLVKAVGPDGAATDLSVFKTAAVAASAIGPDGRIRQTSAALKKGQIAAQVKTNATDARIDLSVTMNLTTKSGLALTPVTGKFPLALTLSKEFPVVRPSDQLVLGTAVKVKPTSAQLSLMGSPVGPTKVCFGAFTQVKVPQEAAGTVPTVSKNCVDLAKGQATTVTVQVTPKAAAVGAGRASLPVVLHSVGDKQHASQQVKYAIPTVWRFSDPLNAPVAIAVLVGIALLSIALPLLAMGLANLASARFEIRGLQAGRVLVNVEDRGASRLEPIPGLPNQLVDIYHDQDSTVTVTDAKRFTLFGIDFRAHGTINPFGAPRFTATASAGHKIMSSVGFPVTGNHEAQVGPGLGFVALLTAAEADLAMDTEDVPANLVFLVRDVSPFAGDPTLADRLINRSILWEQVQATWRPSPSARVASDPDPLTTPAADQPGNVPPDTFDWSQFTSTND